MGKGEKPEIRHLLEFQQSGVQDEIWIPRLSSEGWTIITSDGGRTPNKNRGEKLPRLCARHAVTHVLLSPAVHQRPSFEKLLTILSVWYRLLSISVDPESKGHRFVVEPAGPDERGRGKIVQRKIPPALLAEREAYLAKLPPPPGRLFDPG